LNPLEIVRDNFSAQWSDAPVNRQVIPPLVCSYGSEMDVTIKNLIKYFFTQAIKNLQKYLY